MKGDELVSLQDMAKQLDIHPETLRQLHLKGIVKAYRIGPKLLRFDPAEVRESIRQDTYKRKHGMK